tara:strand:- start:11 stop:874 length:864 start_codon:yes stop_codon:yes gene_type:complete
MAVRTEKIQSLTGSAPLTLPKTLPASSKGLQVSTSGVITAPDVTNTLTNLTSSIGSDPGWVLLDHIESDGATTMKVVNNSTTYPASDIYCYEVCFNIIVNYNNNGSSLYWSPLRSGTRSPNGNGRSGVRTYNDTGSGKECVTGGTAGSGTGTSSNNYEFYQQIKMEGMSSPNLSSYDMAFDKTTAPYNGTYGGDGGLNGSFRYYNGSGYGGNIITNTGSFGRRGHGNSYQNWKLGETHFSMPRGNQPTHTSKVNGFEVWDQSGGPTGSANYKVMGFMQLWGMPKTTS